MIPSHQIIIFGDAPSSASGGGTPATITWDPAHIGNLTLSNGNLTFTPNTNNFESVRGTASHLTGKFYFESAVTFAGQTFVGIGNSSTVLLDAFPNPGTLWANAGTIFQNGGNSGTTIQTFASGNILSIAADLDNSKLWFRTNGGNWNNDVLLNQNPATNTGGFAFSITGGGPYFPLGCLSVASDTATANFGPTYTFAVPAGFGSW
jgi:hypothetical protein